MWNRTSLWLNLRSPLVCFYLLLGPHMQCKGWLDEKSRGNSRTEYLGKNNSDESFGSSDTLSTKVVYTGVETKKNQGGWVHPEEPRTLAVGLPHTHPFRTFPESEETLPNTKLAVRRDDKTKRSLEAVSYTHVPWSRGPSSRGNGIRWAVPVIPGPCVGRISTSGKPTLCLHLLRNTVIFSAIPESY